MEAIPSIEEIEGMSPEEVEKLNKKIRADLERDVQKIEEGRAEKSVQADETMARLLGELGKQYLEYKPTKSVVIRLRCAIPRHMRRELFEIQKAGKEREDIDKFEQRMYGFLAKLCIDEPFNTPEAWEQIDEESGTVPDLFSDVIDTILDNEERMRCFRDKSAGKGSGGDGKPERKRSKGDRETKRG